ncbi:MAG: NAD+ synthase [Bacteroidota bacterium]|nr:NAD+ synthase [Bacteroidota bacterium]MDP4234261.1 NAD+ synthase [Bacteroidota bacterium]MDP4243451.1 NAD+ synthase [Bacteroidota bacterium]MDP4289153.1 NAD+ synthase [Bacteroidota bacterium]
MEAPHVLSKSPLVLNAEQAAHVLSIFIGDEVRRTGLKKVVIGLSGGVDSALSTYLSVRALGSEHVHVLLMPFRTSNPESVSDAEAVVKDLGLSHELLSISSTADAFFNETENSIGEMDRMRRGNALARLRMIALYDRSMALGGLVIGTSNKTESLLGYTTLFGDNASAINPLGDLYKTQVWQLAEYLGVPDSIVHKAPSADLWPGQTDEAELGIAYHEVDELLFFMVDLRESDDALMRRGFSSELIGRIRQKIQRSQFKRRPPLIAKISSRTINFDFRYPRDWGT